MDIPEYKVMIAVTGSVAAIKLPLLVKTILASNIPAQGYTFKVVGLEHSPPAELPPPLLFLPSNGCLQPCFGSKGDWVAGYTYLEANISVLRGSNIVAVVVTEHAKHFYSSSEIPDYVTTYDDQSEWHSWNKRGDPVLHIELGKMADMMVIAPLDANTLAKMAQGICDNLLTCTTRAWDMSKPLLFCPAMNTRMWQHPITAKQIATLKEWGHEEIPPIEKTLMCGDTGIGAMAEVDTIVKRIKTIAHYKLFGCAT